MLAAVGAAPLFQFPPEEKLEAPNPSFPLNVILAAGEVRTPAINTKLATIATLHDTNNRLKTGRLGMELGVFILTRTCYCSGRDSAG